MRCCYTQSPENTETLLIFILTAFAMNRRSAIKQLSIATGGIISLPAWMVSCGVSDTETHNSSFNSKEQKTLAAISDTMIPAGGSVGALAVGVDKFLQKLIDDCYEKPVQDNVKKQLRALEQNTETAHDKSFAECAQRQREGLLAKLAASTNKEEKDFFDLMKAETIRGFNTSQKVMEEYLGYKIAPGHYYGCVSINS
jgi:hypothetical protein